MIDKDFGDEAERGSDREESKHLVTIQTFREVQAAMLAKGLLDSVGIECFLADDNAGRIFGFISDVLGGMRLQVNEADAETATALLRQSSADHWKSANETDPRVGRCPMCDCADITFQEIESPISSPAGRLLTDRPATIHEKVGRCNSCGYEWDED